MTQTHDSDTCNCEMCQFASKSPLGRFQGYQGPSEGVNEAHTDRQGAKMAVSATTDTPDSPSTFEHDWNSAPRSRRLRTEQEDALWWYIAGGRAKEAELMEVFNSDLREILRVVRERIR